MKKLLYILLSGVMLIGLLACENNEPRRHSGSGSSSSSGEFLITVTSADETMGTVTGSGRYDTNEVAILKAIAKNGYLFAEWNDGNTENPREIVVTSDTTFIATFREEGQVFNGHEAVDLGLPSGTLWATCNIGANSPEEYGAYFAWGEIAEKSSYNWNSYKWCSYNASLESVYFTKYYFATQANDTGGNVDNLTTLQPSDDAATQIWGTGWRMPTYTEFMELLRECDFEWVYDGLRFSSKVNSNYIILPIAQTGCRLSYQASSHRISEGYGGPTGSYWSSTLDSSEPQWAYYLYITPNPYIDEADCQKVSAAYRCNGLPIRPVYSK